MLPDFLVIGAMKSGTSSLYRYLSAHPKTQASRKKETNFFVKPAAFRRDLGRYERNFSHASKIAFEASPNYTKRHMYPGVPARIHAAIPHAKLVYLVRDPIERLLSHYLHNVAMGRETRTLARILRKKKTNYMLTSRYFYQLRPFLDFFPKENILICSLEALAAEPEAQMARICAFVGIDDSYNKTVVRQRFHEAREKVEPGALEKALLIKHNGTWNKYVRRAGRPLRRPMARPALSPEQRARLVRIFEQDVARLRRFTGDRFAQWSL